MREFAMGVIMCLVLLVFATRQGCVAWASMTPAAASAAPGREARAPSHVPPGKRVVMITKSGEKLTADEFKNPYR